MTIIASREKTSPTALLFFQVIIIMLRVQRVPRTVRDTVGVVGIEKMSP